MPKFDVINRKILRRCLPNNDEQRKRFIHCIVIGIFIAVLMFITEHSPWGRRQINYQFDFFITQEAHGVTNYNDSRISQDIVFFDIDDIVYREWGRPLLTPRDIVADLIEIAYKGGARVIVSDIEFEKEDTSPKKALTPSDKVFDGNERDERLRQVLNDISASKTTTKIILPGILNEEGNLNSGMFDKLIDNKTIFRAFPATQKDRYDNFVRYWLPYKTYLDNTKIIWSTPLLAVVLAQGNIAELEKIEADILKHNPQNRQLFELQASNNGNHIKFYADNNPRDQYNRIRFMMLPAKVISDRGTLSVTNHRKLSNGKDVFLSTIPSYSLKDKIVIIGNSSSYCADFQSTPVGGLPGMFIQGNAINTLINRNQTFALPPLAYYSLEILFILAVAYAFSHTKSRKLMWILSFCLGSMFVIAYWIFIKTGVFYAMIIPVSGIGVHVFHELIFERTSPNNSNIKVGE